MDVDQEDPKAGWCTNLLLVMISLLMSFLWLRRF